MGYPQKTPAPTVSGQHRGVGPIAPMAPTPHQVDPGLVSCKNKAQRALQASSFELMQDVLNPDDTFLTWQDAIWRGAPLGTESVFHKLLLNLKRVPEIGPPEQEHDLFVEATEGHDRNTVWLYTLPARHFST